MNSAVPASDALPDRSSFGMIMSPSAITVAYSCAVKNRGTYGCPAAAACARACCDCCAAIDASSADQVNATAAAGADPSSFSVCRRLMSVMTGPVQEQALQREGVKA